jgi:DNA-binding transcriptional ArsR family regulator
MVNKSKKIDLHEMEEIYYIDNLDTLKVITDERRLQMLELLVQQPYTVKQLAAELELAPTKLYYHIKQLEDHELIRVVETQVVSGIIEKTYRAVARRFSVDETVLQPNRDTILAAVSVVSSMFENTLREIRHSADAGLMMADAEEHDVYRGEVAKNRLLLSKEEAAEFRDRYMALIDEFKAFEDRHDHQSGQDYNLLIAFYPMLKGSQKDIKDDDG